VSLIHEGRAQALMKGHLHTDQLLHAILKKEGGLRTNRRLSQSATHLPNLRCVPWALLGQRLD